MTDKTFVRGLMWLTFASLILPPTTGVIIMGFVGIYPFPESLLMFTSYVTPYILACVLITVFLMLRFSKKVIDYGQRFAKEADLGETVDDERTRRILRAFPWLILGFLVLYFIGGVTAANESLEALGIRSFDGPSYLYSMFTIIPCVMITALPLLFLITDHIAKYLAPRRLIFVMTPLWFKLMVLGLFTPVMINSFLMAYYTDRTGFFSAEVVMVWIILVVIAAMGTLVAWQSFRQSLAPIVGGVEKAQRMSEGLATGMRPQSLDEIGVLVAHLASLADHGRVLQETQERRVQDRTRELATERDLAQRYLQITSSMIVALDASGRITLANQKACDVLGWEENEIVGKNWFDTVVPENDQSEIRRAFGQILEGNLAPVENLENYIKTHDGEKRLIAWHNSYLLNEDGTIGGCLSSGQDITEQKQTENSLRRSEREFRLVSEALPAGITYLGRDMCFRLVNSFYAAWFGKRIEDFPGLHVRDLIGDNGMAEMKDYFRRVLSGETVFYERKLPLASGTIHISTTMVPDIREDGTIDGFFALALDVTDKKSAELKLIQSSKMATLGEMATGVAHELNQPMNVIRLAISNIQRKAGKGPLDPGYLSDKLNKVDSQIDRATAIIDHMRIFGRNSNDIKVPLVAAEMVNAAMGMIGEQLRLQDIEVSVYVDNPDSLIFGDQVQIEQVLLNLLGNARDVLIDKDTGGRRIKIRVEQDTHENTVLIEVEDTGGGIDPAVMSRIFEPFYTTKDVGAGTGLGLSISYGIINDMNGKLDARNTEDGACFTISLPAYGNAVS